MYSVKYRRSAHRTLVTLSTCEFNMLALIDETSAELSDGMFYVVATTVLLESADVVRPLLAEVVGERSRPFHWAKEGTQTRDRMLETLCAIGALAVPWVHHPTARKGQERARQGLLAEAVVELVSEGVNELILESRDGVGYSSLDAKDAQTLRNTVRSLDVSADLLAWSWAAKSEPLLWAVDAVCGATREFLLGDPRAWDRLVEGKVLEAPRYRRGF
jgi:hypothetical protein